MRYFIYFLLTTFIFANGSKLCKTCHPLIYKEYKTSMHFKSTLSRDKIHNAVWQKHPLRKKNEYKCAKCHDPKVDGKLESGVDCISCHKIRDIKEHSIANSNVYEKEPKTFYSKDIKRRDKKVTYHKESSLFGLFSKTIGSPYHHIDYRNKIYYNGKVCMGCHSHLKNANGVTLCKTPIKGAENEKQNCITCHMPKVLGSSTTIKITKKHAYHGFLGAYNNPKELAKYVDLNISESKNGFRVTIKNNTPHPLFTHPLRVVRLIVEAKRGKEVVFKKNIDFYKVFGKDNITTMPPFANRVLIDSMLKEEERRDIDIPLNSKNINLSATLGYFLIDKKSAKALGIKDKELLDFIELKRVEKSF